MLWFILGTICGGFLGVFLMCLFNVDKLNDEFPKDI